MPVEFVGTEILVNTATTGDQINPQITALFNGGFVVTWQDDSQGVGGSRRRCSRPAAPRRHRDPVNTAAAGGQFQPQITALSNGGFVVTWEDFSKGVGGAPGDASNYAVKAQVFAAGGAPVGSEILVNTATANDQISPLITALSNGGFVVTWQDGSQGVGGAQAMRAAMP